MSDWAQRLAGEELKMSHGARPFDGRYFQGSSLGRGASKLKYLSIPALMQVLHELDEKKCPSQSVSQSVIVARDVSGTAGRGKSEPKSERQC